MFCCFLWDTKQTAAEARQGDKHRERDRESNINLEMWEIVQINGTKPGASVWLFECCFVWQIIISFRFFFDVFFVFLPFVKPNVNECRCWPNASDKIECDKWVRDRPERKNQNARTVGSAVAPAEWDLPRPPIGNQQRSFPPNVSNEITIYKYHFDSRR